MKSFWFILSVVDVEGRLPIEIIPEHWFDKADAEQILFIKEMLKAFTGVHYPPPYEYERVEIAEGDSKQKHWKHVAVPSERWRYWVINSPEGNLAANDLGIASALLEHELELGFTVTSFSAGGHGYGWQSGASSFFAHAFLADPVTITEVQLNEVSDNYGKLKAAEIEHPHIFKAARRFHSLRSLPRTSEMLVIGYFAIIETLVAHKPRLQESLDSINHQLRSEMTLLAKRFRRQLDYAGHFGNLSSEKIWKELYAYRSAIAHDNSIDFHSEFKALRNPTNVLLFLREVVKSLLLLGLDEPVFLSDLKNC